MSDFALGIIKNYATTPLFDMEAISPGLCQSKSKLRAALEVRKKAAKVMPFLNICKSENALE